LDQEIRSKVEKLTSCENNNNKKKKKKKKSLQLRCILLYLWPLDVAPVVLRCFQPNLYCACAETAIAELPVNILTLPLDSATTIS